MCGDEGGGGGVGGKKGGGGGGGGINGTLQYCTPSACCSAVRAHV